MLHRLINDCIIHNYDVIVTIVEMESIKFEYRVVIKFLLKEGCKATAIHQRLVAVYGDSAPNYST